MTRAGLGKILQLTGSPTVTTPYSFTTLGWLNWPMMAASCRNLTWSSSHDPSFIVLTATSVYPECVYHTPRFTIPNCPEPRLLVNLHVCVVNVVCSVWPLTDRHACVCMSACVHYGYVGQSHQTIWNHPYVYASYIIMVYRHHANACINIGRFHSPKLAERHMQLIFPMFY